MRMKGLKRFFTDGVEAGQKALVEKLLATIHQCPNRIVDGHDAGIEIQLNGDTMIDYECESRTQCVTLKFHFCPFCGVPLGESET